MSGLLKRIKGALLIASTVLPGLVFFGSLGGGIGVGLAGSDLKEKTYNAIEQSEIVQDEVEEQILRNAQLFEDGEITRREYDENTAYYSSHEFLDNMLEENAILKDEFQGDLDKARKMENGSEWAILPFTLSVIASFFMYAPSNGDTFAGILCDIARDSFEDAKLHSEEQSKIKKSKKEDEYSEEIVI